MSEVAEEGRISTAGLILHLESRLKKVWSDAGLSQLGPIWKEPRFAGNFRTRLREPVR
jgi:hypothetical protein